MTNTDIDRRPQITTPALLSTLWIAILLADVLRGVHETLRPGFVAELANEGTVYGNEVTNGELFGFGFVLTYLVAMVVASRVLARQPNRWANFVGAALLAGGVLGSWPKDPDDYVFGAFMLAGAAWVVATCVRWRTDTNLHANESSELSFTYDP